MGGIFAIVLGLSMALGAGPAVRRHEERMDVQDVLGTGDGQYVVVLRTQSKPMRYLPIWIGEMEAVAIRMRLDRQEPPRPLTLNLVEQVLRSANIRLIEIAIDDYKGGVFLGKIRLKQNSRAWEMEARPSDAIGLAVGKRAPILVARDILDGAAIDPKALKIPDGVTPPDPPSGAGAATAVDESL